jgi:hypothetical protein
MLQHDAPLHLVVREGVANVGITSERNERICDNRQRLAVLGDTLPAV